MKSASQGSVRFRSSLPRAPPADRFPSPFLSDQESRHGLPALPLVVDHRAGGPNGPWFPALLLPRLRAAVQRADRHGAQPGPGPDRHRVSRGLLEIALQAEPARLGRNVSDPGHRVHPRGGARLGSQAGAADRREPAPSAGPAKPAGAGTSTKPTSKSPANGAICTGRSTATAPWSMSI